MIASPSERRAKFSPMMLTKPRMKQMIDGPEVKSRPRYAPSVKKPTVTATRPITWPNTPAVPTLSTDPKIRRSAS